MAGLRCLALAAAGMIVAPEESFAQTCKPKHGGAVTICGINGGTSSQIFSPGSVIIMRQEVLSSPGDLPNSALPEEAAAVREGMAFLGSSFTAAGGVTGFLTGFEVSRDQDGTDLERGYSSDRGGFIAGMRLERPGYTLAFGFDVSREEQEYASDRIIIFDPERVRLPIPVPPADVDREDIGVSFGGSVDLRPRLVWHGGLRFGRIELETRRVTHDLQSTDGLADSPPDNIDDTFIGRGSTKGTSIALHTGLSHGRSLGGGFHGGISGSLLYVHEDFDGFTERLDKPASVNDSPPSTEGFTFRNDKRTSFVSRLGVEVARPVRMGGAMVVPALRAAWLHEFADDSRIIDVHVPAAFTGEGLGSPDNFTIRTNDPDRNYFTVGASLGALFANGRGSLAVDYETTVGHDFYDERLVAVRFGYRF